MAEVDANVSESSHGEASQRSKLVFSTGMISPNTNPKLIVLFPAVILLLISSSQAAFGQKEPLWVLQRPSVPGYYIGIAGVQKAGTPREYMQRARNAALNDIAEQISVTISGEQKSRISETLGKLSSEYESEIRSSTNAELDSVETVATWDGDGQYWVYCRLSARTYARARAEKIRNAKLLALNFYSKAKASESEDHISSALRMYVQAISSVVRYLGEPLEVESGGRKLYMGNDLVTSFQSLLDEVHLKPVAANVSAKVGSEVTRSIGVVATYAGSGKPIANLPVRFSFVRGNGDLTSTTMSDSDGVALARIARLKSTDRLQIIRATVDLLPSQSADSSVRLIETMLKYFVLPEARIILTVSNLTVCVRARETLFGKPMALPRIEPVLKQALSPNGFSFVDDPSNADILITIEANGRDGGDYDGLYTVYVDADISVVDLSTGQEIYKMAYNDTKGISINYEKAAAKAYDSAASKIEKQILPALLYKIAR